MDQRNINKSKHTEPDRKLGNLHKLLGTGNVLLTTTPLKQTLRPTMGTHEIDIFMANDTFFQTKDHFTVWEKTFSKLHI